jgi:phage terminase large subunit GpA-like protein
MDAMTDPLVDRVTWMKSKRVGYTKVLTALNGYHISQDPCSILHVQPTVEDAEGYSKDEIDPLVRDVAVVSDIFGVLGAKDKGNTILKKTYPGGTFYLTGANSGRGFRRISVRVVQFDEVDAYPKSAGKEGDVISLGEGRAEDAWNSLILIGSTPLIKGTSIVAASFEESDQRRYHVPCPHCDHGQALKWGGRDTDYGLKWPDGAPEQAAYLCENCHVLIEHSEKFGMIERGEWIAARPFKGHAGFHIWSAYSYLPKASWSKLAEQWERVDRNPTRLQVFVNTVLGEPWEEVGDAPSEERLMTRREVYPTRTIPSSTPDQPPKIENVVPIRAVVLTSSTDVQHNRLETQVVGWGRGEELWTLEYHVLYGDPTAEAVWQELEGVLTRPRHLERGGVDFIRSSTIDSGYASQSVYGFVAPRPIYRTADGRNAYTWATKGFAGTGHVWPKKPGKSSMANVPVYPVKVDTAKDTMASRAQTIENPGPGFIHFPTNFGEDYFRQFTAEQAFDRTDKKGFPIRVWEMKKGRTRNEVWDTIVGNYAALCALYSVGFDLEAESDRVEQSSGGYDAADAEVAKQARAAEHAPPAEKPSTPSTPSSGKWLSPRRGGGGWLR